MKFNHGDIVFWEAQEWDGNRHFVRFGIVDEEFSDAVIVDVLELMELRLVNGIPFDEFPYQTKYEKLPKKWKWDTELFEITQDKNKIEKIKKFALNVDATKNPELIKKHIMREFMLKKLIKNHTL